MKNINLSKKIILCVMLIVIDLIIYYFGGNLIREGKWKKTYTSKSEFLKTVNCAEIFDENPNSSFKISFEIRAEKAGNVMVYQQNGMGARYEFSEMIEVTQEYQNVQIIVTPVLDNLEETTSYLAFYGGYSSGVIPEVRKIKVEAWNE